MWSNEYTAISSLPAAAIWNALKALHEGRLTYEGSDTFVLHGPFAKGTRVSVTPVGQEGGTQVTHRLEISGPSAAEVGPELGPQISGDFDTSMAKLFEQAEELASRG